nr:hypothetical protein [Tanacetum cinerariifolium]GEZ33721.1 hypothetical protein [Tanacetum cinerariifolium]
MLVTTKHTLFGGKPRFKRTFRSKRTPLWCWVEDVVWWWRDDGGGDGSGSWWCGGSDEVMVVEWWIEMTAMPCRGGGDVTGMVTTVMVWTRSWRGDLSAARQKLMLLDTAAG